MTCRVRIASLHYLAYKHHRIFQRMLELNHGLSDFILGVDSIGYVVYDAIEQHLSIDLDRADEDFQVAYLAACEEMPGCETSGTTVLNIAHHFKVSEPEVRSVTLPHLFSAISIEVARYGVGIDYSAAIGIDENHHGAARLEHVAVTHFASN